MRYFGSKGSVIEKVYDLINLYVPSGTFCDPFGGIGIVGSFFKNQGYQIFTGDFLFFSHCFLVSRIQLDDFPNFTQLRGFLRVDDMNGIKEYLNRVPSRIGWVTQNYAITRLYFQFNNAIKIDAVWESILAWNQKGLLSKDEYALLIASLINSADSVANTAGTYYAFLKKWDRKALKPFIFSWIYPTRGSTKSLAYYGDANIVASIHPVDVLYLDPPYNNRSYDGYYHFPQSIAMGYRGSVRGKSGIPLRQQKISNFTNPSMASISLAQLLANSSWKWLFLHYSDEGLISQFQIRNILSTFGQTKEFELKAKGYSTTKEHFTKHRIYMVKHA